MKNEQADGKELTFVEVVTWIFMAMMLCFIVKFWIFDAIGVGFDKEIKVEATLISRDNGRAETVWSCGKYGTLSSQDIDIYRYASEKSTLLVRFRGNDYVITGICK